MFETAPNGYFLNDLIVFHGLRNGCHVSKRFILEPADLSAAAPEHLNAFQDQIALLLACLHDRLRLQVQWFCDSDYRAELLRYNGQTERATNVWTRRCRNERFTRYWQAMLDRQLRRQRLVLYFSRQIEASPAPIATASAQRRHHEAYLQQIKQTLNLADFLGHNANAVRWQIWTALLVYLLLRFLAHLSQWGHSFTRLFAIVRAALWKRLDLLSLLKSYGTAGAASEPWLPRSKPISLHSNANPMGLHRESPGEHPPWPHQIPKPISVPTARQSPYFLAQTSVQAALWDACGQSLAAGRSGNSRSRWATDFSCWTQASKVSGR